jgi:hypothetical protein
VPRLVFDIEAAYTAASDDDEGPDCPEISLAEVFVGLLLFVNGDVDRRPDDEETELELIN